MTDRISSTMTYDPPDARRRRLLGALSASLGLCACGTRDGSAIVAPMPSASVAATSASTATPSMPPSGSSSALATPPTVDLHSHAGHVIPSRTDGFARPLTSVAASMREGGLDVVCLAVVADTPVTRIDGGRIHAWREPTPGELYAWGCRAFERAQALVDREGLTIVADAAAMGRAAGRRDGALIASEGADFLEGRVDRVDEFRERFALRQLQLVHYRVNELGDIQTAPPVHGGLTAFGRDVVTRCQARGIVVDVAHATERTVEGVVDAATRPIVLSHTSLTERPPPFSRLVTPAHARLVASTGGVVGIWPPRARFPTMDALAGGMRAMVDAIGIDHVGLGTDLLGLVGPAVFDDYRDLPALRDALSRAGFAPDDVAKVVGGNYARVFASA